MAKQWDRWLMFIAISGALAVGFGALGAHALASRVSAKDIETWKTGAHYHLIHTVAMFAIIASGRRDVNSRTLKLWATGILIFGGTLYGIVLTGFKILGAVTPIGGICLILGWILLAFPQKGLESDL